MVGETASPCQTKSTRIATEAKMVATLAAKPTDGYNFDESWFLPNFAWVDCRTCGSFGRNSVVCRYLGGSPTEEIPNWPLRCPSQPVIPVEGIRLNRRMPAQERRQWTRLPIAIPVFVRSKDEKGKEVLEFATALNISGGGALLCVRRSPVLQSHIELDIPSPPLSMATRLPKAARTLRAKMVRVTHIEGYHLVGVKFSRPLVEHQTQNSRPKEKLRSAV